MLLPLLPVIERAFKIAEALTLIAAVAVATPFAAIPVPITTLSMPSSPAYRVKVLAVVAVKRTSSAPLNPVSWISAIGCSAVVAMMKRSEPSPPFMKSLPAPPLIVSLPASPDRVSFPARPFSVSAPAPPVRLSALAVPLRT